MGSRTAQQHRKKLETIINNASQFNIPDFKGYAFEMLLYKDGSRNDVLTDADIVFYLKAGGILIVEYKSNGNGNHASYDKASSQLAKVSSWFAKYTPYTPEQIETKIISGSDPRYKDLLK